MKKYSKEEIDRTRAHFENCGFEKVSVVLGGRTFDYFVLPQSLSPELPDFVFRSTGEQSDGYVFGISDSVRKDFRKYAVAHEYIEFMELGENKNRCVSALEEELKLVPAGIKRGYIKMRTDFFDNLIKYCTARPDQYTNEEINEFRKSFDRLKELS